ncbi:MAG: elongation factor 1-beta [Candidatus Pacearchaeota archaeon]
MGTVLIKIKMMPASPETNLEEIEKKVKEKLEKEEANNISFEIQPIAFGLKALIVGFAWPEEKELESFQETLEKIENVNSVEVIDMRRAIG